MEEKLLEQAIQAASRVAREGADALTRLESVIRSPAFAQSVMACLGCDGMIYLLGMGKSGLVGQKIAATLTSTGTPASYVHAGDALHGDLGVIRPKDIAILISKSGQTRETLNLIPFLKNQKNSIIAITNDEQSTLAQKADMVLPMLAPDEGCPLNLAPMTSSTATMTLGDALACALIVARGFKAEHFARYHPGGRLGYLLTAKVSDMINREANPVVKVGDTLRSAVARLADSRLGAVNVVDTQGALAGVLTDGDLKRIMISGEDIHLDQPVEQSMTTNPVVIGLDASAATAVEIMENRDAQISVLPVVDTLGKPVGILRLHDVIRTHL